MGDVQIDPHSVGADFELLVALGVGGVRLEEDFGHVASPEMVAAAIGVGVGEGGDGAKAGVEFDEEGVGGPKEADFGFALRVGVAALPVGAKAQRSCGIPLRCGGEAVWSGITGDASGDGGWQS